MIRQLKMGAGAGAIILADRKGGPVNTFLP